MTELEKTVDLSDIYRETEKLERYYCDILKEDVALTRQTVSFQDNKKKPGFRWYKFKEAFSYSLVSYFIKKYKLEYKNILDPFAGVGTTLFAASSFGCNTVGIELLPVGQKIIEAKIITHYGNNEEIEKSLKEVCLNKYWKLNKIKTNKLNELRITKGAYPDETRAKIECFLTYLNGSKNNVKATLELALLSILEEISYTRKDGQYLRWDYRANRSHGKTKFNKGKIKTFDEAMRKKLREIIEDLQGRNDYTLFPNIDPDYNKGRIELIKGSCLNELPNLDDNLFNAIITSPPYCNRYDYTRTYALELALLGVSEIELSALRQNMLTCTVENKEKDLLAIRPKWQIALDTTNQIQALKSILNYLELLKLQKKLNNNAIVRMIKGYFLELSCVIYEAFRVLKKQGLFIMVNDNVGYAGVGIPIDLILSRIAENIGFRVVNILVLPQKKGNSSQQMGLHGRKEQRKCVYVWEKR